MSRRRQSTSVNGVCQAKTTTSSISCGKRGIKDHKSGIRLWRTPGSPILPGFADLWGRRRTAWHDWLQPDPGRDGGATPARLRAGGAGHKAWKWCNFGGSVWEVWRTLPQWSAKQRHCANRVTRGCRFRVGRCCVRRWRSIQNEMSGTATVRINNGGRDYASAGEAASGSATGGEMSPGEVNLTESSSGL